MSATPRNNQSDASPVPEGAVVAGSSQADALAGPDGSALSPAGDAAAASNVHELRPAPKKRKPLDPEKREREALQARVRRKLQALNREKDNAKIAAALEKLDGSEEISTEASEGRPAAEAPSAAPVVAEPAPAPPAAPIATELHTGLAQLLWGIAGQSLAGTRYGIAGTVSVPVIKGGELEFEQRQKADLLVEASIPVLAKYMAGGDVSPEVRLMMAMALVFGAPAIGHAKEAIQKRQRAKGGGA